MAARTCSFIKEDGQRCRAPPQLEDEQCFWHSPKTAPEAKEAQRLGGLRRRKEHAVSAAFEFEGLRTIEDIQRFLEIAAYDTLALENSIQRSRVVAYLGHIALKALQTGDLDERLRVLEQALRLRPGHKR